MRSKTSSTIDKFKDEARDALKELIKSLLMGLLNLLFGTTKEKKPMATAPLDPDDEPQKDTAPQATMDKPKKDKKKATAKKTVDKMLKVENAFPVKENSYTKRMITDIGDGWFRVNYKSLGTGYVIETAVVLVRDDGSVHVEEHIHYDKE
jgi:hypothetical protein